MAIAIGRPFGILLVMQSGVLAFIVWIPASFAVAMPWGAAAAAVQELVPKRMRGRATAVYLLVTNLVGLLPLTSFVRRPIAARLKSVVESR